MFQTVDDVETACPQAVRREGAPAPVSLSGSPCQGEGLRFRRDIAHRNV